MSIIALGFFFVALYLFLAALGPSVAAAAPSTGTSIQLQGETKAQVESLQSQAAAVEREIDDLDVKLEQLSESYNEVALRLEQTNQDLAAMRRRLQDTHVTYDYRRAKVDERLVASYKAGSNSFLEILMATDDFTSFVKRLILLYHVTTQDQQLVEDVAYALDDLSSLEAEVDAKKSEELRLREELEQKRAEIETTLAERQSTLDGLDGRIAQLVEQERQRQEAERQRLEAELRSKTLRLADVRWSAAADRRRRTQPVRTDRGRVPGHPLRLGGRQTVHRHGLFRLHQLRLRPTRHRVAPLLRLPSADGRGSGGRRHQGRGIFSRSAAPCTMWASTSARDSTSTRHTPAK